MRRSPAIILAALLLSIGAAFADAGRDAILAGYLAEAKQADPAFAGFSADAGKRFFLATHQGGKPDTPSCTTCHTKEPTALGQTRAGKSIDPMAVSLTPARFTDPAKVEKWFGRNCESVLGRACTPAEKGNFITFMSGL